MWQMASYAVVVVALLCNLYMSFRQGGVRGFFQALIVMIVVDLGARSMVLLAPEPPTPRLVDLIPWDLAAKHREILHHYAVPAVGIVIVCFLLRAWTRSRYGPYEWGLRLRGVSRVHYEAMKVGSVLEKASIPHCQIQVVQMGFFGESHIGYGIRIADVLVVPRHVLKAGGWPKSTLVVRSGDSKGMVLEGRKKESSTFDLAYFFLSEDQWSTIGAKRASVCKHGVEGYASCAGYAGESHGDLRKTNVIGQYSYGGSTKAGYSGAAYVMDGRVAGIHIGVDCEKNVGLASVLVLKEIELLVSVEGRNHGVTGLAAYDNPMETLSIEKKWDDIDIEEVMFSARSGDERAADWLHANQHKHGRHYMEWEAMKAKLQDFSPRDQEVVQRACQVVWGQSDVPIEIQPTVTVEEHRAGVTERLENLELAQELAVEEVRTLAENVEDIRTGLKELDEDTYNLCERVSFLEKRLSNVEIWAIDRGFSNLPEALFKEDSEQVLAYRKRRFGPSSLPAVQRAPALRLKTRYGEAIQPTQKTPPLVRKIRNAIQGTTEPKATEMQPISLEQKVQEKLRTQSASHRRQYHQSLLKKQTLTPEESLWEQFYLNIKKTRNRRRGKRSTKDSANTSPSSGKNEPSTSSQAGPSGTPGKAM